MKKSAKQRLVKYLQNKSTDEISKIVKDKNLGEALGVNRKIKAQSGGGIEGSTEIVGDPRIADGMSVRKLYNVEDDSPIASIQNVIQKTRTQRKLNTDSRTQNLFAKYVPGSLEVSKNKKVVSVNSEYVPDALNEQHRRHIGNKAEREASKVLGRDLKDISGNKGNVRSKVVDFMDPNSLKTYPEQTAFKMGNPDKKVSDRLRKGLETHPKTRIGQAQRGPANFADGARAYGKSPRIFGDKTITYGDFAVNAQKHMSGKLTKSKEELISNLKKKFYN